MSIRVLSMRDKAPVGATVVNVCSNSPSSWSVGLSPFMIGPCDLYGGHQSRNVENGWQYAKLYLSYANGQEPSQAYWDWAVAGWANPKAIRYPMGKGAVPLGAWWDGRLLGYIEARKRIYTPLYAKAVMRTASFEQLKDMAKKGDIWLRDFDGYDHVALGMSLTNVLNTTSRKMGHAFVLAMLLTNDPALVETDYKVSSLHGDAEQA